MKKHYPWLWFDADGTLFDYNRAEETALKQTFRSSGTPYSDGYLEAYREINQNLWLALERREITPSALQVRRFELLLEALDLAISPLQMSQAYVEHLAQCVELVDGAPDVLQALHATCRIAVVTNGLQAVQRSRLAHSRIRDYVSELIISEEVGAAKPEAVFFAAAFARLGDPDKSEVLLIGDSLTSDMRGGANYGLDTCWFNPSGAPRPNDLPITYEITHLRQLLEMVE